MSVRLLNRHSRLPSTFSISSKEWMTEGELDSDLANLCQKRRYRRGSLQLQRRELPLVRRELGASHVYELVSARNSPFRRMVEPCGLRLEQTLTCGIPIPIKGCAYAPSATSAHLQPSGVTWRRESAAVLNDAGLSDFAELRKASHDGSTTSTLSPSTCCTSTVMTCATWHWRNGVRSLKA